MGLLQILLWQKREQFNGGVIMLVVIFQQTLRRTDLIYKFKCPILSTILFRPHLYG